MFFIGLKRNRFFILNNNLKAKTGSGGFFGALVPLSTKFHLYHGGQLYWRRKTEFPETNRLAAIAEKLYHISLVNILVDELPTRTVFLSMKPLEWYQRYLVTSQLIQFVRIVPIFYFEVNDCQQQPCIPSQMLYSAF